MINQPSFNFLSGERGLFKNLTKLEADIIYHALDSMSVEKLKVIQQRHSYPSRINLDVILKTALELQDEAYLRG